MTLHSSLRTETFEWVGPIAGSRLETGMSGLAYLNGIRDGIVDAPPIGVLASAELLEIGPGRVRLICSVTEPEFGLGCELDPGVASFLVDTAISCVARTLVGLHQGWATAASNAEYVRPASPRPGVLLATAEMVESSDGRALVKGELTDVCGQVLTTVTTAIELFDLEAPTAR